MAYKTGAHTAAEACTARTKARRLARWRCTSGALNERLAGPEISVEHRPTCAHGSMNPLAAAAIPQITSGTTHTDMATCFDLTRPTRTLFVPETKLKLEHCCAGASHLVRGQLQDINRHARRVR